jgi:hypothetical protein
MAVCTNLSTVRALDFKVRDYAAMDFEFGAAEQGPFTVQISNMDCSPPEICHKIFTYACLDNGFTGRSLSLVSKYITETSKPTRFQSIAIQGHEQISKFAVILERTPPHLRHVRHLFVSTQSQVKGTWRRLGPVVDAYGRDVTQEGQWRKQENDISAAIQRILLCIAPTVQTLALFLMYEWRSMLLSVPLPCLTELTIRGSYFLPSTGVPLVFFESFRYLHIGERRNVLSEDLRYISKAAPSLTHLRFTGTDSVDSLCTISPTVTNIVIQNSIPPFPGHCGTHYESYLYVIQPLEKQIMEQNDSRFIYLKAPTRRLGEDQQKGEAVLEQWLERMHGGQGCWIERRT